jgi:hypothetical protein
MPFENAMKLAIHFAKHGHNLGAATAIKPKPRCCKPSPNLPRFLDEPKKSPSRVCNNCRSEKVVSEET